MSETPREHLEAGRALDALVAEKVMGDVAWDIVIEGCSRAGRRCATVAEAEAYRRDLSFRYLVGDILLHGDVPHYSTDTRAALAVVEHMMDEDEMGARIDHDVGESGDPAWWVQFHHYGHPAREWAESDVGYRTLPLAVCRAALATVDAPAHAR